MWYDVLDAYEDVTEFTSWFPNSINQMRQAYAVAKTFADGITSEGYTGGDDNYDGGEKRMDSVTLLKIRLESDLADAAGRKARVREALVRKLEGVVVVEGGRGWWKG